MNRKTTQVVGSFQAKAGDGREYRIQVWQDFEMISSREGTDCVSGPRSFRTVDGRNVTRVKQGEYRVAGFETISLKAIDPTSP